MKRLNLAIAGAIVVTVIAGCTNEPLAEQYRDGAEIGYISGDGTLREYAPQERLDPVEFTADTDEGETVSSSDYAGEVYVVNFWYASCPPCREEADDLEALAQEYREQGVSFLGVNISDQAATSQAFARKYSITYPSVLDVNDNTMNLAFARTVPPGAVPTTVVVDREGRVAARILGLIDRSSLASMIDSVLAESD